MLKFNFFPTNIFFHHTKDIPIPLDKVLSKLESFVFKLEDPRASELGIPGLQNNISTRGELSTYAQNGKVYT